MPLRDVGDLLHDHQIVRMLRATLQIGGGRKQITPLPRLIEQAGGQDVELVRLVTASGASSDLASGLLDLHLVAVAEDLVAASDVLAFRLESAAAHLNEEVRNAILISPLNPLNHAL